MATSNSTWPPSLKDFVSRTLAASTADNKSKVSEEMRKIIYSAYTSGQMHVAKWEDMDPFNVLESLKNQRLRTTATPSSALPKQFGSTKGISHTNGVASGSTTNTLNNTPTTGQKRKKGNANTPKKSVISTSSSFPSPYTFSSSPSLEDEARAKRARRFEREMEIDRQKNSGPLYVPSGGGGGGHHENALDVTDHSGRKLTLGNLGVAKGGGGKRKWLGSRLGMDDLSDISDPNVIDWDRHTIVGTNMRLEKSYLRLTSEPDPSDIRPLPVLRQTLDLLKKKWKDEENYAYICDQFKSLRQDLTVQRIKNEFTVSVYEIHARMALQVGDLGEYNQCQSMLKQLYERDIPGKPEEFLAYRILYLLHTQNKAELSRSIGHLTAEEKAQGPVKQALDISTALATGNYHRFFKLYMDVVNMGGYIMDQFVARERVAALTKMSKAYISLPLTYVVKELAFDDEAQCHQFLEDHNAAIYTNPTTAAIQTATPKGYAAAARRHLALPTPTPLAERIWDCRKSYTACEQGNDKYKKVDIKGQL